SFKDRVWNIGREGRGQGGGGRTFQPGRAGRGQPQRPQVFDADAKRRAVKDAKVDMTSMREEILLAGLLNHPDLFEDVGERLGSLAFTTLALDNLRQEALKTLSGVQGLDRDSFQNHLRESGYAGLMDSLLSSRVYGHAYFARPDEDPQGALEGWNETY
ncbi:MAG: DNA primase, partial [Alphaproteobacteria bacterium]|nr:DNA primase [Alphaproteobacteria bacterium]